MNAEFPLFEKGEHKFSEGASTLDHDITPLITVMHRVNPLLCYYGGRLSRIGAIAQNRTDYQPSSHCSLCEIIVKFCMNIMHGSVSLRVGIIPHCY